VDAAEVRNVSPSRVVSAHGPVGDREQHARVAGEVEPQDRPESGDQPPQRCGRSQLADDHPIRPAPLGEGGREGEKGASAEEQERPRAARHWRVRLEHRPEGVGLDQHVPEPLRAPEINGQDEPAEAHDRERDEIAEADERAIPLRAEASHQRGQEVAASGEPAQEEVGDDEPSPLRRRGEERARHPSPPGGQGGFRAPGSGRRP
jgi:hypothetical protein